MAINLNNTVPIQSTQLVRGIATSLAGLALVLTATAYGMMIRYASPLTHGVVLPSAFLKRSIHNVLTNLWPPDLCCHSDWAHGLAVAVLLPIDQASGRHNFNVDDKRQAVGYLYARQFKKGVHGRYRRMAWIEARSPAMKSLIQTSIWEFVAVWLIVVATANTAVYNGFVDGNPDPDGILRLALVAAYAIANLCHLFYATKLVLECLDSVAFQATWALVSKLAVFLERYDSIPHNKEMGITLRRLQCEVLGETQILEAWQGSGQLTSTAFTSVEIYKTLPDPLTHLRPGESITGKAVKPLLETEIKTFEKATESGLERTLANIFVVLGICLATGLAPWTSARSPDSTAAQLGSYALLLALGTGAAALLSSITSLSTAANSAGVLRRLQAHMVVIPYRAHAQNIYRFVRIVPDADGYQERRTDADGYQERRTDDSDLRWTEKLKMSHILGAFARRNAPLLLLFGPAVVLLPGTRATGPTRLESDIGDVRLIYNTHGTLEVVSRSPSLSGQQAGESNSSQAATLDETGIGLVPQRRLGGHDRQVAETWEQLELPRFIY